jgi:hypothetical protein
MRTKQVKTLKIYEYCENRLKMRKTAKNGKNSGTRSKTVIISGIGEKQVKNARNGQK